MPILQQIETDFLAAFKSKNEAEVAVLRLIKAALLLKKKEAGQDVSENDVLSVLQSLAKKHRDSIASYDAGGRSDLVAIEQAQLACVQRYLPKTLTPDELRMEIEKTIQGMDEEEKKNFGLVMKKAMAAISGRADGAEVSRVVKELLNAA